MTSIEVMPYCRLLIIKGDVAEQYSDMYLNAQEERNGKSRSFCWVRSIAGIRTGSR